MNGKIYFQEKIAALYVLSYSCWLDLRLTINWKKSRNGVDCNKNALFKNRWTDGIYEHKHLTAYFILSVNLKS